MSDSPAPADEPLFPNESDGGPDSIEEIHGEATLRARPDRIDETREVLRGLVEPTRAEPGNRGYALLESWEEPGLFRMREHFANRAAFEAHVATPHMQAFVARVDELLAELTFTLQRPLA